MATILVQIGHVNGKSGAPYEEQTLLLVAPHVAARLRSAGHTVVMLDGTLQYEPARSYGHDGDGCVFLHCDSNGTTANRFSVGYWEEEHAGSMALALMLRDVYAAQTGIPFWDFNISAGEHFYYGNTRVAHRCRCCLIELGFVSNPTQRAWLQANAQRVGFAVADAYIRYFGGKVLPKVRSEMGIATEDSGAVPVTSWRTAGLVDPTKQASVYVDVVNCDSKPIEVKVELQLANGNIGNYAVAVPINAPIGAGKNSADFVSFDVAAVFNNARLGNFRLKFSATGAAYFQKTQTYMIAQAT